MDELACNGNEARLDACNWNDKTHAWQWGNLTNSCTHANDIGIGCDNFVSSTDKGYPNIRIVKNNGT